jgi:hypothetical protein
MPILDTIEQSLRHFHPKTHRQFVIYNIARQFDDLGRLARYLTVGERHPKKVLLEAARLAQRHAAEDGTSPADWFFRLLASWDGKEAA